MCNELTPEIIVTRREEGEEREREKKCEDRKRGREDKGERKGYLVH